MSNLKAVPLLFSPSYSPDPADVHKYFVVIFPVLTTPVNVLCYSLITTVGHRMILLPCSGREYFSLVLLYFCVIFVLLHLRSLTVLLGARAENVF